MMKADHFNHDYHSNVLSHGYHIEIAIKVATFGLYQITSSFYHCLQYTAIM